MFLGTISLNLICDASGRLTLKIWFAFVYFCYAFEIFPRPIFAKHKYARPIFHSCYFMGPNFHTCTNFFLVRLSFGCLTYFKSVCINSIINDNPKVKSIIVTEVTVMSPFIMYSSQNPWNFLDMEVIMIKEDVKCLSPFHLKSIRVTLLQ